VQTQWRSTPSKLKWSLLPQLFDLVFDLASVQDASRSTRVMNYDQSNLHDNVSALMEDVDAV
jgi:hypothetical protein